MVTSGAIKCMPEINKALYRADENVRVNKIAK